MRFEKIDFNSWCRREYFEHYYDNVPCTYSITTKINITKIIENNKKIYPAMLYFITSIVNRHVEFRTTFNENNELGYYDEMLPCYTIFHSETETFSNIWTNYSSSLNKFVENYENDLLKYKDVLGFMAKANVPDNTFPVSMIPWTSFEGFNLNLKKGYQYLLPIFTMGKYYKDNNSILIPLSIQVHHAIIDGFHVSRFIDELQEMIENYSY